MTEIAFYHLTHSPLEAALPKLLEKTLEAGKRAVVRTSSEARVEHLGGVLWTYDPASWLVHGSAKDGHAEEQPIWLTCAEENPNRAEFLFVTDGASPEQVDGFERCFELFDGTREDRLQNARQRWKAFKAAGHALTYWQQTERGGWQKKDT